MKNYVDGGDAILEAFRNLNLDYVISSPGSEWGPVWEAFANQTVEGAEGPTYISCWHETLAVNMAYGYTAVTGKMQGVLLHAGAGLLQGSMGINAAKVNGIPMVIMSGESPSPMAMTRISTPVANGMAACRLSVVRIACWSR